MAHEIAVIDTRIITHRPFTARNGASFALVEIAYPALSFEAGQIIMVKACDKDVRWGYPYELQSACSTSFSVIAPRRSDLCTLKEGDPVTVWGPRGKGALRKARALLVAEPSTYVSVLPMVFNAPERCDGVIFVGKEEETPFPLQKESLPVSYALDVNALLSLLEKSDAAQIVVSLNPQNMKAYGDHATEEVKAKTMLYVPTKIVCGISACAGCVIYSENDPMGIRICEEGPFIAMNRVDINRDLSCFVTRI